MNWFKNKMAILALALSRVEKNALSQEGNNLSDDVTQVQKHHQNMLADDLLNGRVTEEVKLLRHRMYKILDESSKYKVTNFEQNADGTVSYDFVKTLDSIKKIKGDPFDDYHIELMVDNKIISASIGDCGNQPDDVERINPIICKRDILPKFEIEKYVTKLYVRTIDESNKLLEFYVSKYNNSNDRRSSFFISEINKLMKAEEKKYSDILDIKSTGFISFNTLGTQDFREFVYNITEFDKIVEYDGFYIIKFKAMVSINGESIVDKYKHDGLDKKYEEKSARVSG